MAPKSDIEPNQIDDHGDLQNRRHEKPGIDSGSTTVPPPKTKFPTSLSDLHNPPSLQPSLYQTLHALHQHTLSPLPRLRSINTDAHFIRRLHHHTLLPLIANERCGSWYVPPSLKAGSAYFKSTDGHYGHWAFSLRRLNLGLLDVLGEEGGAVLVDSTRRGKGMSDALRRTVGVWVGVVNAVCFGEGLDGQSTANGTGHDNGRLKARAGWLQTPPGEEAVSQSERSQVESRLGEWCTAFLSLGLDIDDLRRRLRRPIRCIWAINGEWDFARAFNSNLKHPNTDTTNIRNEDYNILLLASASRRVRGAEMSEQGYIQGAADDSEGWSRGLTAEMWWDNHERLLGAGEEEIEGLIDEIVAASKVAMLSSMGDVVSIERVRGLCIGAGRREPAAEGEQEWDLIVNCQGQGHGSADGGEEKDKMVLDLCCRDGKMGSKDLREKLVLVRDRVAPILSQYPESRLLVTCSSGTDLSVGVALALMCLFYDDCGNLALSTRNAANIDDKNTIIPTTIDKLTIKKRLVWITNSRPEANPSRATLQAVNSFLIGRPS